jgi:hypothetical protein
MAAYTVDTDGVSGTYATLNAAFAALSDTTLTENSTIDCYASTGVADTTTIAGTNFNTTTNYRMTVIGHTGYKLAMSDASKLYVNPTTNTYYQNITFQNVAIEKASMTASYQMLIHLGTGNRYGQIRFIDCNIWGISSATYRDRIFSIDAGSTYGTTIVVKGCTITSRCTYSSPANTIFYHYENIPCYIYNNTIKGYTASYTAASAAIYKNNLVKIIGTGGGTVSTLSDYNVFNIAFTFGGANDHASHTFSFVDENAFDYHLLSSDTGAIGFGVAMGSDSYYPYTTDKDGISYASPPACGAYEYSTGGFLPVFNKRVNTLLRR